MWKIKTSFFFLRKSCRLKDNVEKYGRAGQATDDNIIRRMRIAYWLPKPTYTHTHTEHVIPIAFPFQRWLQERASVSRYVYIACLVCK
jgi:hypothetical protein